MQGNNEHQSNDKLSMTVSVFIALCLVSIFCAISIIIVENIDNLAKTSKMKHVNLPNNRELSEFVL